MKTKNNSLTAYTNELIAKLPDRVTLSYVDYRDNMDDETWDAAIIESIMHGDRGPLYDKIDAWDNWDQEIDSIESIIRDTYTEEEQSAIEESEELREAIHDAIRERDDSDMVSDLERNTSDRMLFYRLPLETSGYTSLEEDVPALLKLAKKYQIPLTKKEAMTLCENASYGGALGFLFLADPFAFIHEHDPKTITIDRPALAIIDYLNGSGMDISLSGPVTVPYSRDNVGIERYYTETVCGLYTPAYAAEVAFSKATNKKTKR